MTQSKQIFQSDKKTYYIYHIPGQKIGMTCNLNKRVELEQGYKKNEYDNKGSIARSGKIDKLILNQALENSELSQFGHCEKLSLYH